jgi:hypothetical protein
MTKTNDDALAKALQRRADVIDKMKPALRAQFEALCELADRQTSCSIAYHHSMGERVARIRQDAGTYGPDAVSLLAKVMLMHRATLQKAVELYDWKPTQAELKELTSKRGPAGRALSWGHVSQILALPPDERDQVVQCTLDRCWTVRELADQLRVRQPCKPLPDSSMIKPKNVTGGLIQVTTMAERLYLRLCGSRFDRLVLEPLETLDTPPADKLRVLERTESARTALLRLIQEAACKAEALRGVEDKLRTEVYGDPEVALDADELPVIKVPPAPGSARNAGRAPANL